MARSPSTSNRLAASLSQGLTHITNAASWIWLLLILLIVTTVVLRYAFGTSRIEFEELEWHLYAIGFLAGIVACANHDRHVRVDVFRERMSARMRCWVDFYGILLLQIPFLALVLWSVFPFVADSFATGERSTAAGGLPYRWALKAFLPIAFGMLAIATATRLRRAYVTLFGSDDEVDPA